MNQERLKKEQIKVAAAYVSGALCIYFSIFLYPEHWFFRSLWGGGLALFGLAFYYSSRIRKWKNEPDTYIRDRIEAADERNQMITVKAKSAAFDAELFLFIPVFLYFAWRQNFMDMSILALFYLLRFLAFFWKKRKETSRY